MTDNSKKVVELTPRADPAELLRKQKAEAERLSKLSSVEWPFWAEDSARKLGIPVKQMTDMVKAILKDREKAAAQVAKEEKTRAARQAKQLADEQRRKDKEAAKIAKLREKEKEKTFKRLADRPVDQQERGLAELAARIEVDESTLQAGFQAFIGPAEVDTSPVELWPEPVNAKELLPEIITQLRRYIVCEDHQMLAIALWIMFAWMHDVAVHSPMLVATSPEIDSGKTTLLGVLEYLVPRPYSVIEANAANIYRNVDATLPTVIMDEADTIFERKTDLRHIFLSGWTRGRTVPRRGHRFRIFCPKAIGLKFQEDGRLALPESASSRSIIIKMKPKLVTEVVEDFASEDDETFKTLRRKLGRWAEDNMEVLAKAKPKVPEGFNNRLRQNWKLLLAIAEHAGTGEAARSAAIKLAAHQIAEPSLGKRYLAKIQKLLVGRDMISSKEIVKAMQNDPDEDFGHVSEKKLSLVLGKQYDIHPEVLHPTSNTSIRGYKTASFADTFARYLRIQTLPAPEAPPARKVTSKRTSKRKGG